MAIEISPALLTRLTRFQRMEMTGSAIYRSIAERETNPRNRGVLFRIAAEERDHAAAWRRYTRRELRPERLKIRWYLLVSRLFGYTFAIRLMERNEERDLAAYRALPEELPELRRITADEQNHEQLLLGMLDEERLKYVGAMVLGVNDALVELSGTLAGLTFALADARVVALAGIVTGVSATLSMAASNYLAERAAGNDRALTACFYTGGAYLAAVTLLVLPYLLFPAGMYLAALGTMLAAAVLVIVCFSCFLAVVRSQPFRRRFGEMACISLGVMLASFLIGLAAKSLLGVDL